MIIDVSEWWRKISEYLPTWARITLLSCVAIGEGLRQLANLMRPDLNYAGVNPWGWTIFAMFIAFPCVFLWRLFARKVLREEQNTFEAAEAYIRIISMAMKEARFSKIEQQFQWRAVMQKLANEFKVGGKPPTLNELELDVALRKEANRLPEAPA